MAGIRGAMQYADERRHLERLLQVVVGAELGGLDGGLNRAVRGHQHDGQARLSVVKLPHEFQAAESWQAQVRQHHIAFVAAGAAQPLVAAIAHGDLETVLLEHVAQVSGQTGVVFNEKNSRRSLHSRQCPCFRAARQPRRSCRGRAGSDIGACPHAAQRCERQSAGRGQCRFPSC